MEDVRELMSLIDTNSDKIPEGDYLTMCNKLKSIFTVIKNPMDVGSESEGDYEYETDEEYTPSNVTVNVIPFTPTPAQDPRIRDVHMAARRHTLNQEYLTIIYQLKNLKRTIKQYTFRRNITTRVKREAVNVFCSDRLMRLNEYTFSELVGTYPQYIISDERQFYLEYITYHNNNVRETTTQLACEIERLEFARDECIEQYEECQ